MAEDAWRWRGLVKDPRRAAWKVRGRRAPPARQRFARKRPRKRPAEVPVSRLGHRLLSTIYPGRAASVCICFVTVAETRPF